MWRNKYHRRVIGARHKLAAQLIGASLIGVGVAA